MSQILTPGERPGQWQTAGDHDRRIRALEAVDPCGCFDQGNPSLIALIAAHIGTDLVSWWRMGEDQATGPNLEFDYAQNPLGDKPLSLSAGSGAAVTWDVAGCVPAPNDDGALQFNYNQSVNQGAPDGSYFAAADVTNKRWEFNGTDPFTVACLFKPTAGWNSNGNYHGLVSTNTVVAGSIGGWHLSVIRNGTAVEWAFVRVASSASETVCGGAVVSTSGDCHLAVGTYDGATMNLYVDGALVGTAASAISVPSRDDINVGRVIINQASVWERFPYGVIDEVAIFSAALGADEIAEWWVAVEGIPDYWVWTNIGGVAQWAPQTIEVTY